MELWEPPAPSIEKERHVPTNISNCDNKLKFYYTKICHFYVFYGGLFLN